MHCSHSSAQTDFIEPYPICTDNFVWCAACEAKAAELEVSSALLQQIRAELSAANAVIADHQQREKEEAGARRALHLQVEQLQNMLLLESGRAAHIQNSSDAELRDVAEKLEEQRRCFEQQMESSTSRCQQIEQQLEGVKQELEAVVREHSVTRQALEEALREASAAAAIELHVKSKLSAAQITISDLKTHQEQQLATFSQQRCDFEQQITQRDDALKQAHAQIAELRQRCPGNALRLLRLSNANFSFRSPAGFFLNLCSQIRRHRNATYQRIEH